MLSLLHHPLSCRYLQSMSIYPSFTHPQSDNLRTMSTLVFLSYTHIYLGTIYSLGYLGRQVLKIIMQPNTFLVISKQSSHQSTVLYRCLSLSQTFIDYVFLCKSKIATHLSATQVGMHKIHFTKINKKKLLTVSAGLCEAGPTYIVLSRFLA